MMYDFLANNRAELIARCRAKVLARPRRATSHDQVCDGVPIFLEQLITTLVAEEAGINDIVARVSGPVGGAMLTPSEIGVAAAAHGKTLLSLGFNVEQVVHDYGDLCQAITELAQLKETPFRIEEFHTLNRCLDNAIADAVSGFCAQRDVQTADLLSSQANKRLGYLVHELRNALQMANLSVRAMEVGGLTLSSATGTVLKRSLVELRDLVDSALAEVRARSMVPISQTMFSLAALIEEARTSAQLEADVRGCVLLVAPVDPAIRVRANRDLLLGALGNLLSNAFKFTHRNTSVSLVAYEVESGVVIDVEDRCGGLPANYSETLFTAFSQQGTDRTGLGMGLLIARQNVESMGGALTVKNLPEVGCVFTITFPDTTVGRVSEAVADEDRTT